MERTRKAKWKEILGYKNPKKGKKDESEGRKSFEKCESSDL